MIFSAIPKQYLRRTGPLVLRTLGFCLRTTTTNVQDKKRRLSTQSLALLETRSQKRTKKNMLLRKPKGPLSCYNLYARDLLKKSKSRPQQQVGIPTKLTFKSIAELWNNETKEVVEKYKRQQAELRLQYAINMSDWNNQSKSKNNTGSSTTTATTTNPLTSSVIKKQLSCYNIYVKEKLKQARESYVSNGSVGDYPTVEDITVKWRDETNEVKQFYRAKADALRNSNNQQQQQQQQQQQLTDINPRNLTAYSIYKQHQQKSVPGVSITSKTWKNETLEVKQKYERLAIKAIINYQTQIKEWNSQHPKHTPLEFPVFLRERLNKLVKPIKPIAFNLYKDKHNKKNKKHVSLKQIKKSWKSATKETKLKYKNLANSLYFEKVQHWNQLNPNQFMKLPKLPQKSQSTISTYRKPVNSYVLYMMDFKKKNPSIKMKTKEIAMKWRNESKDVKTKYAIRSSQMYEMYKLQNNKSTTYATTAAIAPAPAPASAKVKKLTGYNMYVTEQLTNSPTTTTRKEISKNWKNENEQVKKKYRVLALLKYFKDVDVWNNLHSKDNCGIMLSDYMVGLKKSIGLDQNGVGGCDEVVNASDVNDDRNDLESGELVVATATTTPTTTAKLYTDVGATDVIGLNSVERMDEAAITLSSAEIIVEKERVPSNIYGYVNLTESKSSNEVPVFVDSNTSALESVGEVRDANHEVVGIEQKRESSDATTDDKMESKPNELLNFYIQQSQQCSVELTPIFDTTIAAVNINTLKIDNKSRFNQLMNSIQVKNKLITKLQAQELESKDNNDYEIIDTEKAIKKFELVGKKGKRR